MAKGVFSLLSSVRASETLPLLTRSSLNALLTTGRFNFPRTLSRTFYLKYAFYLTNKIIASYSLQRLASKNISILSFIPPTWIKTSALAHSFVEKIGNAPGARFLPSAQTACWIPAVLTTVQITCDSLCIYTDTKYPSLVKLRDLCEQVANKLNALFFALLALYSFKNVGGPLKAFLGGSFLVMSFVGGIYAEQSAIYLKDHIPRGVFCSVATSLFLGKYVKELSWLPQSQAHLVIGALNCWSAFRSTQNYIYVNNIRRR